MDLRGKTVLVTGGAVRIGRAICETLAARGCDVVIHYRRSAREADTLAGSLCALGVRAVTVQGELQSERDVFALVENAWTHAGKIDFLVNNAAVFHKDDLRAADERKILAELQINLVIPWLLVREFAARAGQGAVVNLLDRRIASNVTGCLPYLLSKKALAEFTRVAALELAPRIRVNGVAPGPVLPPPGQGEEYLSDQAGKVPLQGPIAPREIAEAVAFLLGADAITGQVIFVDGGQHLLGNGC